MAEAFPFVQVNLPRSETGLETGARGQARTAGGQEPGLFEGLMAEYAEEQPQAAPTAQTVPFSQKPVVLPEPVLELLPPDAPATLDLPTQPETPETPEMPELLEAPKAPETPDLPAQPETQETPGMPELLKAPKAPETPDAPDVPETPDAPDLPEAPENSDAPELPETPEAPEAPDAPEVPEAHETPELPKAPETPDRPAHPEAPRAPVKGARHPAPSPEPTPTGPSRDRDLPAQPLLKAPETPETPNFPERPDAPDAEAPRDPAPRPSRAARPSLEAADEPLTEPLNEDEEQDGDVRDANAVNLTVLPDGAQVTVPHQEGNAPSVPEDGSGAIELPRGLVPPEAGPQEATPQEATHQEGQPHETRPQTPQPHEAMPQEARPQTERQSRGDRPREAQPQDAEPRQVQPQQVQPREATAQPVQGSRPQTERPEGRTGQDAEGQDGPGAPVQPRREQAPRLQAQRGDQREAAPERARTERQDVRTDFQSFFEGVLTGRRPILRTEPAPMSLTSSLGEDYTQAETLREGLVNVVRFVRADGAQRASVIVDPPAIGRVSVELTSTTAGVEASIKVSSEQVRQLVQDQLTQLRMTLEEQGVQVTQFAVDVQQDDAGGGQRNPRDAQNRRRGRRLEAVEEAEASEEFRVDLEQGLLHWVA